MDIGRQRIIERIALQAESPIDYANIAYFTLTVIPKAAEELKQFFACMRGTTMTMFPREIEEITEEDVNKVIRLMENGYDVKIVQNAEVFNGYYAKTQESDLYSQYSHYNGSVLRVFGDNSLWITPGNTNQPGDLHVSEAQVDMPDSVIFYVYIVFCVFVFEDRVARALQANGKLENALKRHPMLNLLFTVVKLSMKWRQLRFGDWTMDDYPIILGSTQRLQKAYESRNRHYTAEMHASPDGDEPGSMHDNNETYENRAVLGFMQEIYKRLLQNIYYSLGNQDQPPGATSTVLQPNASNYSFRLRLTLRDN
tara:strand:+ start:132 stop:1064 length:933 start_codon:yes stop_codon:yes gene_type:complete